MDILAAVNVFYTGQNTLPHFIRRSTTIAIVDIIVWATTEDTVSLMALGHQVFQLVCEVSSFNCDMIFIMLYQRLPILCLYVM